MVQRRALALGIRKEGVLMKRASLRQLSCLLLISLIIIHTPVTVYAEGEDKLYIDPATNNYNYYSESDGGQSCSSGNDASGANATGAEDTIEFVKKYVNAAVEVNKKYGIPYETILAQGIGESSHGTSGLTVKANNFFGIKANQAWLDKGGDYIEMETMEQTESGESYTVMAKWRSYATIEDGWLGYGEFITSNSIYSEALKYPGDPIMYLQKIKDAGYATDTQYVSKITELIREVQTIVKDNNLAPPSSEIAVEGGGGASSSGNGCNSKGVVSGSIVDTAKNLAWSDGRNSYTAKPEYIDARNTSNPEAGGDYTDCGKFVATVMRASGADPDYPPSSTSVQKEYLEAHPEKYLVIQKPTADQLQPGDILVYSGHTLIYTGVIGSDSKGDFVGAQASLGDNTPTYIHQGSITWQLGRSDNILARLIKK